MVCDDCFPDLQKDRQSSLSQSTLGLSLERSFGSQTTLSGTEFRPLIEELEEAITLSSMATPKQNRKLHIPVVRIHDAQVGTVDSLRTIQSEVTDFVTKEHIHSSAPGQHVPIPKLVRISD